MFELAPDIVALLVLAAFVAGFVDSIAGGGALIVIPALMLAGLSPLQALGTNKLQAMFGVGSATFAYAARGHVDLKAQLPMAAVSFLGSVAGAAIATLLPGAWLAAAMPLLLIAIGVYFALKPNLDDSDRARRISPLLFGLTVVPLVGFYDGLFGPGAGSFFMLAFVSLAGFGLLKATAHTKLLNFASNIGGFITFALAGVILWKLGIVMGIAQFVGARLGAALAMRVGARLIKPLLVVVCLALALRLLLDPANPLRVTMGF